MSNTQISKEAKVIVQALLYYIQFVKHCYTVLSYNKAWDEGGSIE